MGQNLCNSTPSQKEIDDHNKYNKRVHDSWFLQELKVTDILTKKDTEKFIQQTKDLIKLQKKLTQLTKQQSKVRDHIKFSQFKCEQFEEMTEIELNGNFPPRVLVEIRKGRNLPNTGGCFGSKYFVTVTVNPLGTQFKTVKQKSQLAS